MAASEFTPCVKKHFWAGWLPAVLVAVAIMMGTAAAKPPAKPAPKPVPPPAPPNQAEIKRLQGEISKLKQQCTAALGKIQARYVTEVAQLNLPGLHALIARLHRDERAAVWKQIDKAKLESIRAQHKPEIQSLQQQIKERQAHLAKLTRERNAELAKIRVAGNTQIAKLDPPEDKLERLLARAIAQERLHIYKLVDQAKVAKIRAAFQPQIDDANQQIKARALSISARDKQKKKEMAAIRALFKDRLATLNPAEGQRLELELESLREAERFELDNPTPGASKGDIRAAFQPKIDGVKERLRAKEEAIASLKQEEKEQIAAVEARIRAEVAADAVEEKLETRLGRLHAEEKAALHALLDPVQVKAVVAKYQPEIDSLRKRVRAKEAVLGRINAETQTLTAKVESEYHSRIAKLNVSEDKLEFKLARVEERERQEIRKLIGPDKLKAIRDKYEPAIAQRLKELHIKHRQLMNIGRKASTDSVGTMNYFTGRIGALQARIVQLSMQPPPPRRK